MNLHELVSDLIIDTKGSVEGGLFSAPSFDSSLGAFMPELVLCVTIVLLLFIRLFNAGRKVDLFWVMLFGTVAALACGRAVAAADASVSRMEIFTGMLVYDPFTVFMRNILIGFAVLFAIFTKLSGIPDREDGAEVETDRASRPEEGR